MKAAITSNVTKAKYDESYTDTRGTNSYWRDPKKSKKSGKQEDLIKITQTKASQEDGKLGMWTYQYGKQSQGKGRVKAVDLYENWMDDPNALPPGDGKKLKNEDDEGSGQNHQPRHSKYATEPHKPKSNYRYWTDYEKEAPDSDKEDERLSPKTDNLGHDDESNEKNGDFGESDNHSERGTPQNGMPENQQESFPEDKQAQEERDTEDGMPILGDEIGDQENKISDHEKQEYQNLKDEEPPIFIQLKEDMEGKDHSHVHPVPVITADNNQLSLEDLEEITDTPPDDNNDRNEDSKDFPSQNMPKNYQSQDEDLSSSQSGLPPSPAKRVRKHQMKRQKTKTQFEEEENFEPEFGAAGVVVASDDTKQTKSGSTKKPKNPKKKPSVELPPGFIADRRKSSTNNATDLDVEIRNREKERQKGETDKKGNNSPVNSRSREKSGGRSLRRKSKDRIPKPEKSPRSKSQERDTHRGKASTSNLQKAKISSANDLKPLKNKMYAEHNSGTSPRKKMGGGKNLAKKEKAPRWKPWGNKAEFDRKGFINDDVKD